MICWTTSWPARVCAAILNVNEIGWGERLYDRLELPPLSPQVRARLRKIEEARVRENERRRCPVYRKQENKRRKTRSQAYKAENQDSLYKGVGVVKKRKQDSGVKEQEMDGVSLKAIREGEEAVIVETAISDQYTRSLTDEEVASNCSE